MGRQAPNGLVGVHFNFLDAIPKELLTAALSPRIFTHAERDSSARSRRLHAGYISEMSEHLQTIGYSLDDSPIGLAASILDHDANSYAKIEKALLDGKQTGNLSRDNVLDNITLYSVTVTGLDLADLLGDRRSGIASLKNPPPHIMLPAAYTVFPHQLYQRRGTG